jgi:dolichol-phosphate mannosyltransferase
VRRKAKLVLDSLIGFSSLPVTACWVAGLVMTTVAAVMAGAGFGGVQIGVLTPPFVVLVAAVGVVGGIVLSMLGMIGEYVWRTLDQTRARPRFVVEETTVAAADRVGVP